MRKIRLSQILVFIFFLSLSSGLAIASSLWISSFVPFNEYRPLAVVAIAALLLYGYAIIFFRVFMGLFPLPTGEISENSRDEFVYHVYLLFFLILFYPIIRSGFTPVPLMRLFYQSLGAKMGTNSYSSGLLLDPSFISMGSNCIIGQFSLLVPHVIEGHKLAHFPIILGNNVTIGASSVVLSGVQIGDGAIVSTGAVVTKGTVIGPNEIWGGIPAKLIGRRSGS